eukprot:CAMPEP_0119150930 /NCGR_PEP_ID=MMETSP1310-20130426/45587_1 /TAXON_ID=464262 /ORGANISM="Genus nov. species nov., Strain RCC2339" /LENGTH=311 /DNA_ID=CAMNT_0007143163 /DNA_START=259 /DNA_END=1197 /DNA_ORIENTATION=-
MAAIVIVTMVVLFSTSAGGEDTQWDPKDLLKGVHESHLRHRDIVYQVTDGNEDLMILAHGCFRHPTDFWQQSPLCPTCTGLPEERKILLQLVRTMDVVAIGKEHTCWAEMDLEPTVVTLRGFMERKAYRRVFAFGISSGGSFAGLLATRLPLAGIICQISVLSPMAIEQIPQSVRVAYVHMDRDHRTGRLVTDQAAKLEKRGHAVREFVVPPISIDARFFSNSIPVISEQQSKALYDALVKGKFLKDGFLSVDVTDRSLLVTLKQVRVREGLDDPLILNGSAILEELKRAYGFHEITADHFQSALRFIQDM